MFWKKEFWTDPRRRLHRIALFTLLLTLLTEASARVYFARRGIIDRNPGNTTASMPYLLEQLNKSGRPRVVFIGSSVTQGYGNCLPGTHFPGLVEKELRSKPQFRKARVFNLASAGNRFGDHLANLVEAARAKPDLVVAAIHIKMFSVHASLIDPLMHDDAIYYFRDDPLFRPGGEKDMATRFRITGDRYREVWLDYQVQRLSALYRHRRLLGYLTTGNHQFPAQFAADRAKAKLEMIDPILTESYDTTQEERNADYLWKVIPDHVVRLQYQHCEAFDFSDENLNWTTFKEMAAYAKRRRLNLIFFLNPINEDFVKAKGFFDWGEVLPLFKQRVLEVTQANGVQLIDATTRIDSRYFSDLDHLNMNGHKQMAQVLLPHVLRVLRRE